MLGVLGASVDSPPVAAPVLPPTAGDHLARTVHRMARARLVDPPEALAGVGVEGVPVELHRARRYAPDVTVAVLTVAFVLMWAGATLLIDAWLQHRRRPSLCERLAPYMPTLADEVETWLTAKGWRISE